ncbi:MAG: saccharopine dehydrogenase NADP-binding domain-containing protein [Nannocystaceae bacterium]|nr:saccharopine dehydrogenase NADP-binding domain-containing protein [Nannocystaceae bacterium]
MSNEHADDSNPDGNLGGLLIYGAYGYTGRLIAERAAANGGHPVLAGRDKTKVEALGKRLEMPTRAFPLDRPGELDAGLKDVDVVLHCAGPFSRTAEPMAAACLRTGTHYLDITGEISVFETMKTHDAAAKQAGVMLMPGTGFDVVPTDCLASYLSAQLPDATHLVLAFAGSTKASHGTAMTAIENIGAGGAARKDGKIISVPAAWKVREIDFDGKQRVCATIPWGDISTAFHSTAIPNIEVFMAVPPGLLRFMKASRWLGGLLGTGPVQRFLKSRIPEGGPDQHARETGQTRLWGEVSNAAGETVSAHMKTPESYQLTAITALMIAERVLAGDAPVGFQTPAKAYGADLVLEVEGVTRR